MNRRLHIGCGPRILSGWVNIDKQLEDAQHTLCADATALPYGDGSAEAIYCEDLFEHLSQREQFQFLAECYRVLSPGGCCRITCPELTYSLTEATKLNATPWQWGHILIPTREYFAQVAELAGFHVGFTERNGSSCAFMPEDLRPHPPREDRGNIFADLTKGAANEL